MANHYLVHWDGYQSNLQAAFEQLFLAESFVDVTLAVESGLIKCHRVVLSAASGFFKQLLAHQAHPHPIIFMKDVQYWELIALVDFMYRGEVSVEEDKLEQLMRAAQTLQIHGLSAVLRACLQRQTKFESQDEMEQEREGEEEEEEGEESQESGGSGGGERQNIGKLCELNNEVELRPIRLTEPKSFSQLNTDSTDQKNVVKEEIEFVDERSSLSPVDIEPVIKIQNVYSGQSRAMEDNSNDYIDIEDEPQETPRVPQPEQSFHKFLLVRPQNPVVLHESSGGATFSHPGNNKGSLSDLPLYKRYSPKVLEQALRDLQTGRFNSIRACARHHGIPMTTLRYRAKGNSKRPHWIQGLNDTS